MEETILLSHGNGVFADAVHRICNGYEHKHADTVSSERVSVLWRVSGGDSVRARSLPLGYNYLERAVAENLNIVEVLDHIFSEEAKSKRKRAYEKQIQMSGFPIKKTLDDFDFSFQPSIDKRQIDELATMRFLENGENVVFLGRV